MKGSNIDKRINIDGDDTNPFDPIQDGTHESQSIKSRVASSAMHFQRDAACIFWRTLLSAVRQEKSRTRNCLLGGTYMYCFVRR